MIREFGEAAVLVEVEDPDRAQALAASLRDEPFPGVITAVPGLRSLLVEFDPLTLHSAGLSDELLRRGRTQMRARAKPRLRSIPVVYGGEFGPDLQEVASVTGLAADTVIQRHTSAELRVLFDGFAAGFAYLGDLPDELHGPRLATPRTRIPRGSVGIAGAMSGVYPAELPGGWQLIGRTPISLFDALRDPPAYLVPGDHVRFEPIQPSDWDRYVGAPADW